MARQQIFESHIYGATSATSTAAVSANLDITAGAPTCTLNADHTVDCTVTATTTPSSAGVRSATLTVSNASAGASANIALDGAVAGSTLAFDHVTTTTNNTTTPVAPMTNALLSGIAPAGVAVDGAGNTYAASGASIVESISGTAFTLSTAASMPIALPAAPSQIAVDPLGDVYAVTPASTEHQRVGGCVGRHAVSLRADLSCLCAVRGLHCRLRRRLRRTRQAMCTWRTPRAHRRIPLSISCRRRRAVEGQQATVATGFANPVSLAVDPAGNVYVADKGAGAVYKLAPAARRLHADHAALGRDPGRCGNGCGWRRLRAG